MRQLLLRNFISKDKRQSGVLLCEHFEREGTIQEVEKKTVYKVKEILVSKNKRLSYQSHKFRSETWVIVKGIGLFTLNDTVHDVHAGTVIEVPCGAAHRIGNVGDEDLIFIEVQRGTYLGEDDILRLQDDFGRAEGVQA